MSKAHIIDRMSEDIPNIGKYKYDWLNKKNKTSFILHITDVKDFIKCNQTLKRLFPEHSVQLDVIDTFKFQLILYNSKKVLLAIFQIDLTNFSINFTRTYKHSLTERLLIKCGANKITSIEHLDDAVNNAIQYVSNIFNQELFVASDENFELTLNT